MFFTLPNLGADIHASICAAVDGGASFSLYWMDSDLSHLIAKFPRRDGPDRRLVGVRDKRRRHDCLIDSIQQFARVLEILGFDLFQHLRQDVCLPRGRRTLPAVDTIYGSIETSMRSAAGQTCRSPTMVP